MMKIRKSIIAAIAIGVLMMGVSACQKGPAERAGEKIDKTVEKGAQEIEKVGKKIQDDVKGK